MSNAVEVREQVALVGTDGRLYRKTEGLVTAVVPIVPAGDPASVYESIDRSVLPPLAMLKWLYDSFMGKYDHETMVVFGKKRDADEWVFVVPKQKCDTASVEMDDDDECITCMIEDGYRYVGTVHTHPSDSSSPSGVDTNNWKKPEFSGLHYILGRQGSYHLCAVVGGVTWVVEKGTTGAEALEGHVTTYCDKTFEELITKRQPTFTKSEHWGRNWDRRLWEKDDDYDWRKEADDFDRRWLPSLYRDRDAPSGIPYCQDDLTDDEEEDYTHADALYETIDRECNQMGSGTVECVTGEFVTVQFEDDPRIYILDRYDWDQLPEGLKECKLVRVRHWTLPDDEEGGDHYDRC